MLLDDFCRIFSCKINAYYKCLKCLIDDYFLTEPLQSTCSMNRVGWGMKRIIRIGLDIGSTTVKVAILDNEHVLLHKQYERHFSEVSRTVCKIMDGVAQRFSDSDATISITGSSGMAVADRFELDFTQEVFACSQAIERFIPQTDVAIELGGRGC